MITSEAWRTLILQPHEKLILRDGQIVICDAEAEIPLPIENIGEILVSSSVGSISLPLLVALSKQNTKVIFCDEKAKPISELTSYDMHTECAGRIMDQAEWNIRRKDAVWRQIVSMKIKNQMNLLRIIGNPSWELLDKYLGEVKAGDPTNREAVSARLYFDLLFGKDFIRFSDDNVNAALNYGYTIILSAFNRSVVSHGFSTALGIHHCSRQNPFNLSSDLMEPFRPFVDRVVNSNRMRDFDIQYRQELVGVLQTDCVYDGKRTSIDNAIDSFVVDFLKVMELPRKTIKEVEFVEK